MTTYNTPIETSSPLYAEPITHIGSFVITNSMLSSWIAVFILVTFLVILSRKIKKIPQGIQNIFEIILEKAFELADSVTGDRRKSEKFLPITLTLFLFILVNNWMGLLPGMGTIGFVEKEKAHLMFVPFLRGGTADINTTLALALFAVVASHIFGILTIGTWNHFNKYINLKAFRDIPRKIKKDFSVIVINPIKAFVGLIEIIGEIAKVASLSFRLFGNVFAGEVLLVSMMAICAYLVPLPFMFMELLVGLIQALIFAMLALVYLVIATDQQAEH